MNVHSTVEVTSGMLRVSISDMHIQLVQPIITSNTTSLSLVNSQNVTQLLKFFTLLSTFI